MDYQWISFSEFKIITCPQIPFDEIWIATGGIEAEITPLVKSEDKDVYESVITLRIPAKKLYIITNVGEK